MICAKCGRVLPADSGFCQYCGAPVIKNEPTITPTTTDSPKPVKVSKKVNQPKISKKIIIIGSATVFSVALVVILAVTLLIPGLKYNHAKKLLESGNYELAYTAFSELGDFSNAEEMLKETRYVQAVKYRDNKEFELANNIFRTLGNYRDSALLIHNHEYRVAERIDATCTTAGSETQMCAGCGDSFILHLDASHKYVVASEVTATCTAAGSKTYQCAACGNQYSEAISKKNHSYSAATCTSPSICSVCKSTTGNALGHTTNGTVCSRCHEVTFKTLSYSGTGSKVIDYSLPNGKFKVTVTMTSGKSAVDAKVHYSNSSGDSYEWLYVTNSGDSEVKNINGPVTSGTIVVNASSDYLGSSSWKITIAAVG